MNKDNQFNLLSSTIIAQLVKKAMKESHVQEEIHGKIVVHNIVQTLFLNQYSKTKSIFRQKHRSKKRIPLEERPKK